MLFAPSLAHVPHAFTGRAEGDQREPGPNHALLARLGLAGPYCAARQVHGAAVVAAPFAGSVVPDADAVLTTQPGTVVAVRVADCVPVLLAGPGVVCAVHAGWRGTAADVVRRAVVEVCSTTGLAPGALRAAIGPCIRGCCYEVGPEVVAGVGAVAPGLEWRSGQRVDLALANAAILGALGVAVEIVAPCTACSDGYWSYRRDRDDAGRQVGAIGLPA